MLRPAVTVPHNTTWVSIKRIRANDHKTFSFKHFLFWQNAHGLSSSFMYDPWLRVCLSDTIYNISKLVLTETRKKKILNQITEGFSARHPPLFTLYNHCTWIYFAMRHYTYTSRTWDDDKLILMQSRTAKPGQSVYFHSSTSSATCTAHTGSSQ